MQLLVGALVVDTATLLLLLTTGWGGTMVREWYRQLRTGAYLMDVLSLVVGTSLAVRLVGEQAPLWQQLAAAVGVQLVHDLAFGALLRTRWGERGLVMRLFRRYADEMGWNVLWADALMMVATVVVAHVLARRSVSVADATLIGASAAYVGMLLVYSV